MEYIEFLLATVGLLGGLAVWFVKRTVDQHDERIKVLQEQVGIIKNEYLHKNDFKEFKVELREMFHEIRQDIKDLKK